MRNRAAILFPHSTFTIPHSPHYPFSAATNRRRRGPRLRIAGQVVHDRQRPPQPKRPRVLLRLATLHVEGRVAHPLALTRKPADKQRETRRRLVERPKHRRRRPRVLLTLQQQPRHLRRGREK